LVRVRGAAWALAGLIAVSVVGCANSDGDTNALPSTRVALEAEDWVLVRADSSLTTDDDSAVTLAVDDNRVSGTGPCNAYNGDLNVDGDSVEITHLASTLRACDDSIMEAEGEFFAALESADTIDVSDDELVLSNDQGVKLTFRAFDAREHLVGKWAIVNVATGNAIESVLPDTDPSVTFRENGTVTLATGCNDGQGFWELDGDALTVGPLRQTRKFCSDPEVVMRQEAALVRALESAARVQVTPANLTILNDRGNIALVAVPE
jgi:heat shock protein HslJ